MLSNQPERADGDQGVAELFHVQIDPAVLPDFLRTGETIHRFFAGFDGYTGLDIFLVSETRLLILIRWSCPRLFEQHLPYILNACPVTDWFKPVQVIAHHPAIQLM